METRPNNPADTLRRDRILSVVVGLIAFAVYALTLCRGIYTGDDGDFLTAMMTWSVPHPTGYPTFTILGRLFLEATRVTESLWGWEPAMRINIFTALCGAAGIGAFWRLCRSVIRDRVISTIAALILAFSPTLWQQCLSCEVYSLTFFFLCTCLGLLLSWTRAPHRTDLLLRLAAIYGLSLTNHLTMALWMPAFMGVVIWHRRGIWREGALLGKMALCFALPLSLYAYIFLAARYGHGPVNWSNASTLPALLEHITGRQYQGLMFRLTLPQWWFHARAFGELYRNEFSIFLLLAPLGLWQLWRDPTRRPFIAVTAWIFVVDIVYATNYNIADIYVYFIPAYTMTALWIGAGLAWAAPTLFSWLWAKLSADNAMRHRQALLASIVGLAIPIVHMSLHYAETDKSRNFLESDYARNLIASSPKNSILIVTSSTTFTLWYEKWVRHNRPDIVVINPDLLLGSLIDNRSWYYLHVRRQWPEIHDVYPSHQVDDARLTEGIYLADIIRYAFKHNRPVLFAPDTRSDHMPLGNLAPKNDMLKPFVREPWGVAERLFLKGSTPSDREIVAENEKIWSTLQVRGLQGWAFNDGLQVNIAFRYFYAHKTLAQCAERAGRSDLARREYQQARTLFADKEIDTALERLNRVAVSGE